MSDSSTTVYRRQSVSLIVTLQVYCVKSKWKFHRLFNQQVEESVLSSGANKKLVLILNKIGGY